MAETIYTEEILAQRVLAARRRKESRPMEEAVLAELRAERLQQSPVWHSAGRVQLRVSQN